MAGASSAHRFAELLDYWQTEASLKLSLECERETDGRWLAEVPELPGVMAYGQSASDAMAKAQALALRVLAERLAHAEATPLGISMSVPLVA